MDTETRSESGNARAAYPTLSVIALTLGLLFLGGVTTSAASGSKTAESSARWFHQPALEANDAGLGHRPQPPITEDIEPHAHGQVGAVDDNGNICLRPAHLVRLGNIQMCVEGIAANEPALGRRTPVPIVDDVDPHPHEYYWWSLDTDKHRIYLNDRPVGSWQETATSKYLDADLVGRNQLRLYFTDNTHLRLWIGADGSVTMPCRQPNGPGEGPHAHNAGPAGPVVCGAFGCVDLDRPISKILDGTIKSENRPSEPGDGPTPFPGPEPPHTVDMNGGAPDGETALPHPQVEPITLQEAIALYHFGTHFVTRADDGHLVIHDCDGRIDSVLRGDEAQLAHQLVQTMSGQLVAATAHGRQELREWDALHPGHSIETLTTLLHMFSTEWIARPEMEGTMNELRPGVADAVLAVGLERAADLMVTPVYPQPSNVDGCTTGRCDCCTSTACCASGHTCDCQTYNSSSQRCESPRSNCNTDDGGPDPTGGTMKKGARF